MTRLLISARSDEAQGCFKTRDLLDRLIDDIELGVGLKKEPVGCLKILIAVTNQADGLGNLGARFFDSGCSIYRRWHSSY